MQLITLDESTTDFGLHNIILPCRHALPPQTHPIRVAIVTTRGNTMQQRNHKNLHAGDSAYGINTKGSKFMHVQVTSVLGST